MTEACCVLACRRPLRLASSSAALAAASAAWGQGHPACLRLQAPRPLGTAAQGLPLSPLQGTVSGRAAEAPGDRGGRSGRAKTPGGREMKQVLRGFWAQ